MSKVGLLFAFIFIFCYSFANSVRFEAEDAHIIGGRIAFASGFSGHKYVSIEDIGEKLIFTLNVAADDQYPFTISYKASLSTKIQIRANGYEGKILELGPEISLISDVIGLREGVNTIILEKISEGVVRLDCLDVLNIVHLTTRGATLPFTQYEAENANTNGVIIGPSRDYYTLPSEASGRRAVQLNLNQYVEFNLNASANAIVVRLSIPDSSDGNGQTGILGVNVNGNPQLNLSVTSKYSWTYGNYPYTNNPSDGLGHHFYDDTRGLFKSTLGAGTTVRLIPLVGNFVFTIDLADFYTVPAPYSQPANSLDITTYGADPSGNSDSSSAIQKAINDAQSQGKGLWIPQGQFLVRQTFTINKLTIRGAGPWYSMLFTDINAGIGFYGFPAPNPSVNVEIYDFAMFGDTVVRDDNLADQGIGGSLTSSLAQNIWIEHVKCGIWIDGTNNGFHATSLTIKNTWADGVNFHKGITNSILEQTYLRNTGDDALAMWSDGISDGNNIFQFNTVQIPVLANGVGIYGGNSNSATDNYVADTICEGGGLQTDNRFGSVPLSGNTIFARNTLVRCGAPNHDNTSHNGAIWIYADVSMNSVVNFTDTEIIDSSYAGITFWGSSVTNIFFSNITITTAPYAVEVNSLSGQATFTNVNANDLSKGGIYSCDTSFQIIQQSCSGWSDTHCN